MNSILLEYMLICDMDMCSSIASREVHNQMHHVTGELVLYRDQQGRWVLQILRHGGCRFSVSATFPIPSPLVLVLKLNQCLKLRSNWNDITVMCQFLYFGGEGENHARSHHLKWKTWTSVFKITWNKTKIPLALFIPIIGLKQNIKIKKWPRF